MELEGFEEIAVCGIQHVHRARVMTGDPNFGVVRTNRQPLGVVAGSSKRLDRRPLRFGGLVRVFGGGGGCEMDYAIVGL